MDGHKSAPPGERRGERVGQDSGAYHAVAFDSLLGRLGGARKRSLVVSDHIRQGLQSQAGWICEPMEMQRRAELLEECGTWLKLQDFYLTEGRPYRVRANHCHGHLWCQPCAIVRGSKLLLKLRERLGVVLDSQADLRPYLLTVTVKGGGDLVERFEHLTRCWRSMLQRRRVRPGRRGNGLSLLEGGVYSIEAKRGRGSGLWHVHLHAVVLAKEALPVVAVHDASKGREVFRWPELSQQWEQVTGDSKIIECHPITDRDGQVVNAASDRGAFVGALCEVCKYAVKFSGMAAADVCEAAMRLKGRILWQGFGCLMGVKVEDDGPDETALAAFVEYEYRWQPSGYSVVGWRYEEPLREPGA